LILTFRRGDKERGDKARGEMAKGQGERLRWRGAIIEFFIKKRTPKLDSSVFLDCII
jgi:hypothetical protein